MYNTIMMTDKEMYPKESLFSIADIQAGRKEYEIYYGTWNVEAVNTFRKRTEKAKAEGRLISPPPAEPYNIKTYKPIDFSKDI